MAFYQSESHQKQIKKFRSVPIHCYAAKFGDDLAHRLLKRFARPGQTILDPFAGSGTTLVQAGRLGMNAIGIDVDPIACLITRVQLRRYKPKWLDQFRTRQIDALQHLRHSLTATPLGALQPNEWFHVNGYRAYLPGKREIEFWFTKKQQVVLSSLIAHMQSFSDRKSRDLLSLAISASIIRKWPNTLSRAMDIDHSRPHKTRPKKNSIREGVDLFQRVLLSMTSVLARNSKDNAPLIGKRRIIQGDCVRTLQTITDMSIDCVLTSPPYVNAIDYPRAHKFAEWWLYPQQSTCQAKNYIGLRRRQSEIAKEVLEVLKSHPCDIQAIAKSDQKMANQLVRYLEDMFKVINNCHRVLKPGAPAIVVLADNVCKGERVPVINVVADIMRTVGFQEVSVKLRNIKRTRRRYPLAFLGVMRTEAIIVGRK